MDLQFLEFDCSEDAEGVVCWDALAQPLPRHKQALLLEVARVLAWAHGWSPQGPGALEDGADFDFALQASALQTGQGPQAIDVVFHPDTGNIACAPHLDDAPDTALALGLSLSGTPAFAQAFRAHWGAP